jgi:hypothetical protein
VIRTYIRRHHIGLIALFIALGSGAYAAETAPKNSVVSSSIQNGAVHTADLADQAVTGPKLAPGAASAAIDLNEDANSAPGSPGIALSLHELTIGADCYVQNIGEDVWQLDLSAASSSPGTFSGYIVNSNGNNNLTSTTPFGFSVLAGHGHVFDQLGQNSTFTRDQIDLVYSNSQRVITAQFSAEVNAQTGACTLKGTAIPAST